MSRNSYVIDGKQYWDFYVNFQSKKNPRIRAQRRREKIQLQSEPEAEKYENSLWKEVTLEVGRRENQGLTWLELFEKWDHHFSINKSKKWSEGTRRDIYARLRNHTKTLFKINVSDLCMADIVDCLELAESGGASLKLRKHIKSNIDTIYKWGMSQKYILGKDKSICADVDLEPSSPEEVAEKLPEILTKEEIKIFLDRARELDHPWFPVWFFSIYSGMRASETNALRKQKINLVSKSEALKLDALPESSKKNYGKITVHLSWDPKRKKNGPVKGRWWRTIPVNSKLYWFLSNYLNNDFGSDEDGARVFPKFSQWDRGEQAMALKAFLKSEGLKPIKFHTLRACFATQMLQSGVDMATLMKIGGWRDHKTMMIYVRLAGIDEAGRTEGLDFGHFARAPEVARAVAGENVIDLSSRFKR